MVIEFVNGRYWRDGRPLCTQCNRNLAQKNYKREGFFVDKCSTCSRGYASRTNKTVRAQKMATGCEECGFKPMHHCQIDIDHINGDHSDNRPENRRMLCANCHRLKTWQNNDSSKHTQALDKALDTYVKLAVQA